MRSFETIELGKGELPNADTAMTPERAPSTPMTAVAKLGRELVAQRIAAARISFVARRASFAGVAGISRDGRPRAGDLVLARVSEIGQHGRLENPHGRRAQLYPGDEIIVAYGLRYAPDQFGSEVPGDLGACDLVAGGGIAGRVTNRHARMKKPTGLAPVGLLVDHTGQVMNLRQFAMPAPSAPRFKRNVIAVVGTSMNAGKTTLAANLIRGLSRSGLRVGACKVTGTGSGGDLWSMIDAGAVRALDFTDAGFATTAGITPEEADGAAHLLVSHLEADNVDVVVVEIADGLLQRETSALLSGPSTFRTRIDAVMLAAADALGAVAGVKWLAERNLPLRAISGLVGMSPLASSEVERATGLRVWPSESLTEAEAAARLCLCAPGIAPASRARS